MLKMICFDMDGTIADLYGVKNWLYDLEHHIVTPYEVAKPMWDMEKLADALIALGIEIRVITWLAKDSNKEYDAEVRKAKIDWLKAQGFPFDKFHGVQYGTTKASVVRRYLDEGETAILIDDNAKVRKGWSLGETVDPRTVDIVEWLAQMVK